MGSRNWSALSWIVRKTAIKLKDGCSQSTFTNLTPKRRRSSRKLTPAQKFPSSSHRRWSTDFGSVASSTCSICPQCKLDCVCTLFWRTLKMSMLHSVGRENVLGIFQRESSPKRRRLFSYCTVLRCTSVSFLAWFEKFPAASCSMNRVPNTKWENGIYNEYYNSVTPLCRKYKTEDHVNMLTSLSKS